MDLEVSLSFGSDMRYQDVNEVSLQCLRKKYCFRTKIVLNKIRALIVYLH
jgi:hypothetical protein